MKVISADQMRLIDAETIKNFTPSLELMEHAGRMCAFEIEEFAKKINSNSILKIVIICGSGNNGGDGFVIARYLEEKFKIKVFCTNTFEMISQDAQKMASKVKNLVHFNYTPNQIDADIIVDCILGTGINRTVSEKYATIIELINRTKTPVISIDIPSGINGNNGKVMGFAIKARLTLSIGLPKTAYFINNGPEHTGMLRNLDIGFPREITENQDSQLESFFAVDAKHFLIPLEWNDHKYSRGQCLIIGGSPHFSGAPLISADSAAVSGAGMVVMARPGMRFPQNPGIVCLHQKSHSWSDSSEVIKHITKSRSILIGPGLEINEVTRELFKTVIKSTKNLVIDASAIDLIANNRKLFPINALAVITPHEGELKRLAKSLDLTKDSTLETAISVAKELNVHVILKGPQSKVISPYGRVSYNSTGSPALSCAGSGDALAGIIVSLLSGKKSNEHFFELLQLGVFIHGMSSELFDGPQQCFTPGDFPKYISRALAQLSSNLI